MFHTFKYVIVWRQWFAGYQCHFCFFMDGTTQMPPGHHNEGVQEEWGDQKAHSSIRHLLPPISYVKHPSEKPRCSKVDQKMTMRRQIVQRRSKTMSVARKLELARVLIENWSNLTNDSLILALGLFFFHISYKTNLETPFSKPVLTRCVIVLCDPGSVHCTAPNVVVFCGFVSWSPDESTPRIFITSCLWSTCMCTSSVIRRER